MNTQINKEIPSKDLMAFANSSVEGFKEAIKEAKTSFDTSTALASSYKKQMEEVGSMIGMARVCTQLAKIKANLPISTKLYNDIKSKEEIALTWLRGDKITAAEDKLAEVEEAFAKPEISQKEVLHWVLQVEDHKKIIHNYKACATTDKTSAYLLNLQSFIRQEEFKEVLKLIDADMEQGDLKLLLEYNIERLENMVAIAEENMAEAKKLAESGNLMDLCRALAPLVGRAYISVKMNGPQSLRTALVTNINSTEELALKYYRNYDINGAKNKLKIAESLLAKGDFDRVQILSFTAKMKWHRRNLERYTDVDSIHKKIVQLGNSLAMFENSPTYDELLHCA